MADSGKKLTARLRQRYRMIALCIAMGMTEEAAAAHCQLPTDRVQAYLRDNRFQEFLNHFNHEIEGKVIERITRRRVRAVAKFQVVVEEAADKVISLMRGADRDSVSLAASKGILLQANIDLSSSPDEDRLNDPEAELQRKDPTFFELQSETMKELGDGRNT